MSVRVTAEQEQAIAELAQTLTQTHPELVALVGEAELSPGAVLKMVVARGIAVMQADMKAAGKPSQVSANLRSPAEPVDKSKRGAVRFEV